MNALFLSHVTTAGPTSVPSQPPVVTTVVVDLYQLALLDPDSALKGSAPNRPAPNANLMRKGDPLITWNDTFDHNYHTRGFYEKVIKQDPNGEFTRATDGLTATDFESL